MLADAAYGKSQIRLVQVGRGGGGDRHTLEDLTVAIRESIRADIHRALAAELDWPVVRDRLQVYEQQTRPLVDFYKDRPTYAAVNGLQSQDKVTADLKLAIERAMAIGDSEERGRARA